MPITSEQREQRRRFLGSSDLPAILGLDPYRTALDVYASKVYKLEEQEDSEAIELGNDFEVPLLRWAAKKLGVSIRENVRTARGVFASNHDALINHDAIINASSDVEREGLEAKVRTFDPSEFGEEGTDQVPARIVVQTQVQCYTGQLERVWVPVLLPWHGRLKRRLYKVERSEPIIEHLVAEGTRFWEEHVLPKRPPEGISGSVEVWKRVIRTPNTTATVPEELVRRWESAKAAASEAEKTKDAAFAELLAHVGDADAFEWGAEDGTFYTYFSYSREMIDGKRLKEELPGIASQYLKPSSYRTAYRKSPRGKRG